MSTRPPAVSAEAVEAHYAQSAQRRRVARRLVWAILVGFVLLLMLTPLVVYLVWQARGRAQLRAQLAEIAATGQPITTGEMAAWHVVAEGSRDITAIWVAALRPFDMPAYTAASNSVPMLAGGNALPPLDQPLPAADEAPLVNFVAQQQNQLAALYAAAAEEGEVRYERDFRQGVAMLVPEAQQVRGAVNALRVEFELLARQVDLEPALKNIEARVAVGETLRYEPALVCMLVRIAVQAVNMEDIRRLAATGRLTDEQLARLQTLVRGIDIHAQLPDALLGERVWCYHAFHQPAALAINPTAEQMENVERETTHDVQDVKRPEDCALALRMLTEMHAAAEEPLPAIFEQTEALERELKELRGGDMSVINRLRFMLTTMLMPAIQQVGEADARGEALRDLTDASLAVRRYLYAHQQPPTSWEDLAPEFLPRTPRDPFSGQWLRLEVRTDRVLLYSIGKDRVDDGGQSNSATYEPDIAVEVMLPKSE